MGRYVRKTARYNGKKYEGKGKTELEALTRLAEKLAAAKRGEELISGAMTVSAWYDQWKETYKEHKGLTAKSLGMYGEKMEKIHQAGHRSHEAPGREGRPPPAHPKCPGRYVRQPRQKGPHGVAGNV